MKDYLSPLGPNLKSHLDLILVECAIRREKETQMEHSQKLWKHIFSNKQNINYHIISVEMLIFEI